MAEINNPHTLSFGKLLLVLGGLFMLTGTTVFISRFDLGAFNIWLSLLIASGKAALVILFFMHLKYEPPLLKRTFIATIFILALVIGFLFFDISFRPG